jgi:hypothetical protein
VRNDTLHVRGKCSMNRSPLSYLRGWLIPSEVTKWTAAGIIGAEQGERIRGEYSASGCAPRVSDYSRLTFFALSASALALAVGFVVTDHWREIHVAGKVGVALIAMIAAHAAGYWYRFHADQSARSEAYFFAASLLFGCVMLAAVDDYYAASPYRSQFLALAVLAWAVGTLPLACAVGSFPLLALAVALATGWLVSHVMITGESKRTWAFAAMALGLLRWSYVHRSRGLFVLSLISLLAWWCMLAVAEDLGVEGIFWMAAVGPLLMLVGLRHDDTDPFAPIYRSMGTAWSALGVLALTVPSVSQDLMSTGHTLRFWLAVIGAVGVAVVLKPGSHPIRLGRDWQPLALLASVTLLPAVLGALIFWLGWSAVTTYVLVAVFNAAALIVVIRLVAAGASCAGCLMAGVAYFVVWVVALAFDLSGSLTYAAAILAVSGAVLLVAGRLPVVQRFFSHEAVPTEVV